MNKHGYIVAPRTIRHEVGHALGFYHTGPAANDATTFATLTVEDVDVSAGPQPDRMPLIVFTVDRPRSR